MAGEDEVESGIRFFKIMMPGFEEKLKLPPAFCEKVKHEKSTRAILESSKGKWEMKVFRGDDDEMILEDGWPGFVHDHGLSLKDFLVFKHTAKLHFDVMVFDVSGCLKIIFPNIPSYPKRKSGELRFGFEFTRCMASKKGIVNIPIEFVRSNNLLERRDAILEDPRGRRWRVSLYVRNWPQTRRGITQGGWFDFVASNEVKVGDFCTFELIPTSSSSTTILFRVHISRNKNG